MPGFTHLQSAQPVTFGHHLMAYVEMFGRDAGRFDDAGARMNECPLGAAALAGTSFPIDREATARALGFARPTANSLDSVSARDFALEALAAGAISATPPPRPMGGWGGGAGRAGSPTGDPDGPSPGPGPAASPSPPCRWGAWGRWSRASPPTFTRC